MGADPVLARAALHFDEEPIISGKAGTGAVFFSGCSLKCVYCQNFALSHENFGRKISVDDLTSVYHDLISQGACTIDLVNPTHFARAVYASLREKLPVPVIWNSSGYDNVDTLRHFEGKVDVYLPDLKYFSPDLSARYSSCRDYFEKVCLAIQEMVRQTGPVELDENGIIRHGTLIRHLVLPGCVEDSFRVLDWIAGNIPDAWVSLMAQYTPMEQIENCAVQDQLFRPINSREYARVSRHLEKLGIVNGFLQDRTANDTRYIPSFDLTGVPSGPSEPAEDA